MSTPYLLANCDQLLRDKLALALANRESEVNVVIGVSKAEADLTLKKLRNMRAGLKLYQPEGSELQVLAKNKHIRFYKEYKPARPLGFRHIVFMKIYATENIRPSAAVDQRIEEFRKGLRSTPY